MFDVQLIAAGPEQQEILRNLMSLYLYDFSVYTGEDAEANGQFTYYHLPRYWIEPTRFPFFIMASGKYAGFVLVRDVPDPQAGGEVTHHMAEFFVMRKYRRKQVGQRAAWAVFDHFPGRWHVAEMQENLPAQAFWRKIIDEYTHGTYTEVRLDEWQGPVQLFQSR